MLRWVIFSVVVVVLVGIATIASTFIMSSSSNDESVPTAQEVIEGPTGTAQVSADLTHDFGVMAQHTDGKHEWTITNTGKGKLKLVKGESTCSCTIANLSDDGLEPGKSTTVLLNWNTKANNGPWIQRATILVPNDPEHPKLDFVVKGTVRPAVMTLPTEAVVDFGSVENDKPHSHEMAIFSIDRPDIKFTVSAVSNPNLLDVSIKPLDEAEMKQVQATLAQIQGSKEKDHDHKAAEAADPNHKAHGPAESAVKKAYKVVCTLKAAAAIGIFNEEISIATDHPSKPKVTVKAFGKVLGPITLTPERLRVLDVSSKRGDSQDMTIWVRGQKNTSFTVLSKPKDFDVRITPVTETNSSGSTRYQLNVKIPAGIAPGNITEDIVLKTNHPNAAEVKIPVAVFVRAN